MSHHEQMMLSVIVPIYNVEEYLIDCLESIDLSTKNINTEVLLIDDGSTDTSGIIAKEYAEKNPKFKYYYKENGGLAHARNYGAEKANGKYLSFIDSDDLVTEDMYEKMIASAEFNETDFAIINVARLDSKRVYDAAMYVRVFNDVDQTVTHIQECDNLIYDTIICNKLIRRDFWVRNGFEFPVGYRFEDMAVVLDMHCKARCISIVKTVGYLWRVREGENKSITQESSSTINIEHRLFMLNRMYDYISEEMHGDERLKRLLDLKILSMDLIIYINVMAEMSKDAQEEFRRIILEFLEKHYEVRDLDKLSALNRQKYVDLFERRYEELLPIREYGRGAYFKVPIIKDGNGIQLKLESELFDETYHDAVNEFLNTVPSHKIDDFDYADEKLVLQMHSFFPRVDLVEGEQQVKAILQNVVSGKEMELSTCTRDGNDVSLYDGDVFDEQSGELHHYNYSGSAYSVGLPIKELSTTKDFYGDNVVLIKYSNPIKDGSFIINTKETDGAVNQRIKEEFISSDEICIGFAQDARGVLLVSVGESQACDSRNTKKKTQIKARVKKLDQNDTSIHIQIECDEETIVGDDKLYKLQYTDSVSGRKIELATGKKIDNTIHFDVDISRSELLENLYEMLIPIEIQQEGDEPLFITAAKEQRATGRIDSLTIAFLSNAEEKLSIWVHKTDALNKDVVKYNRKILYPKYMEESIDNKLIVFESYWGTQYSCNPRALYEYIDSNHPEYKCVWLLDDERTPIKGNGIRVRRESEEYYHYLATTKYLVNNVNFENGYKKRPEQIEIQTMHGTPLKSVDLDVKDEFRSEEERIKYVKKNRRWNYLIAQGKFTKDNCSTWYGFNKKVLCTGYPRTDELFDISEEEKKRIRERLDLPSGKKIILYAPTFRKKDTFEMPLNLKMMEQHLSDEYIFLIRLHHYAASAYKVPEDGSFIFDAGKYSNITDLYKITDILVTDYSSVMFDFALTGNPMVFFAYDLEEYTSKKRGVYFDITSEGPGPIVKTNEELVKVLKAGGRGNEERARLFRDKYLTYECANSSELIYNEVFNKKVGDYKTAARGVLVRTLKTVMPNRLFAKIRDQKIKKDSQ